MEKLVPIIITTMPALNNAMKERYKLIYLEFVLRNGTEND